MHSNPSTDMDGGTQLRILWNLWDPIETLFGDSIKIPYVVCGLVWYLTYFLIINSVSLWTAFFLSIFFFSFIWTDLVSKDNLNMLRLYFQGIESKVRTSTGMFLSSEEKKYPMVQVSLLSNLFLITFILLWDNLEASKRFLILSILLASHPYHFYGCLCMDACME